MKSRRGGRTSAVVSVDGTAVSQEEVPMNIDRAVLAFAGLVVLIGVGLSLTVHPWWIGLTVFAGLNMMQAAFTGFCPAAMAFKALGLKSGSVFR